MYFVIGVQFSFIPSPNITILQLAVYQCTVDEVDPSDTILVAWIVNGTSTGSSNYQSFFSSYSIVVEGIGTHNTTLTIPGAATALNETTVECKAVGIINGGTVYSETGSDFLYIQGIIFFHKCIGFTWDMLQCQSVCCHYTQCYVMMCIIINL